MAAEFSQISNRNYRWFRLKNVYINTLSRSRLPPGMYNYTYSASKTKAFKIFTTYVGSRGYYLLFSSFYLIRKLTEEIANKFSCYFVCFYLYNIRLHLTYKLFKWPYAKELKESIASL